MCLISFLRNSVSTTKLSCFGRLKSASSALIISFSCSSYIFKRLSNCFRLKFTSFVFPLANAVRHLCTISSKFAILLNCSLSPTIALSQRVDKHWKYENKKQFYTVMKPFNQSVNSYDRSHYFSYRAREDEKNKC
uniref:Uncharacterized protein n=1 Tax=Ceratitis capitata TaxID=7213 RepID=W8B1M6_CERCA